MQENDLARFLELLCETNQELPISLIQHIAEESHHDLTTDALSQKIYGACSEEYRHRTRQLLHHTTRQLGLLVAERPVFLLHNLDRIARLIVSKEKAKAAALLSDLLQIAERIEDYHTLSLAYTFKAHWSAVLAEFKDSEAQLEKQKAAIDYLAQLNTLWHYLRKHLSITAKKEFVNAAQQDYAAFFKQYFKSESSSVRIVARYGYLVGLSFYNDVEFYSEAAKEIAEEVVNDWSARPYLVIPYHPNINVRLEFLLIKQRLPELGDGLLQSQSVKLAQEIGGNPFWRHMVSRPQIVLLSTIGSHLLTRYCTCYRKDHWEGLPEQVRAEVRKGLKSCSEMVDSFDESVSAILYINLVGIYTCYLLLSARREDLEEVIRLIEGVMVSYQQIQFSRLYDSLFTALILAYFSLGNYEKVANSHKRYKKLSANVQTIPENETTIHAFFYMSQWLYTGRKQYLNKLKAQYAYCDNHPALKQTAQLIADLAAYYKCKI